MTTHTMTTGTHLRSALTDAEVNSHEDGDGSGDWIAVNMPGGGQIWINGSPGKQENRVDYPAPDHQGWLVTSYPDPEDRDIFTVLYRSGSTDLATDTAIAVAVVRAALRISQGSTAD